jgi:hypothetical protein
MVGCGDSTNPTACPATSVGAVSVSGGLNPTITWAAECGAEAVAVYDAASGMVLHAAEGLHPGTNYVVYVAVLVGTDTLASVGNFTP